MNVRRKDFLILRPQLKREDKKCFNFTSMSQASFNELLGAVQQKLIKENTMMRDSICPEEKLVIAIRQEVFLFFTLFIYIYMECICIKI